MNAKKKKHYVENDDLQILEKFGKYRMEDRVRVKVTIITKTLH